MQKLILKFGLLAIAISVGMGALSFFTFGKYLSYSQQEVLGYLSIFMALSMIILAIRQYKNEIGSITFKQALLLGLGISFIGALGFGVFTIGYMEIAGEEFFQRFYTQAKANPSIVPYSTESFDAFMADMSAENSIYTSSFFQGVVMFFTVFLIGVIVSVLSSMLMQSKKPMAAA